MKTKKLFVKLHLYLALLFALPVVIVSITGAFLVFKVELVNAFDKVSPHRESGEFISTANIVERYEKLYPQYDLTFVGVPREEIVAHRYRLFFTAKDRSVRPKRRRISIDPYTGEMMDMGSNKMEEFLDFMESLHRRLTIDGWGKNVMATSSVGLMIIALIGLYIALPRKVLSLKGLKSLFVVSGHRDKLTRYFSWHKVLGVYMLAVIVIMGFTGISFTWKKAIHSAINTVTLQERYQKPILIKPTNPQATKQFALAVKTIEDRYGKDAYRYLSVSSKLNGMYSFRIKDDFNEQGFIDAYVNPYTGEYVGEFDKSSYSVASFLGAINYELHMGSLFGLAGQLIWLSVCLGLLWFVYSGFYLWIKRRS